MVVVFLADVCFEGSRGVDGFHCSTQVIVWTTLVLWGLRCPSDEAGCGSTQGFLWKTLVKLSKQAGLVGSRGLSNDFQTIRFSSVSLSTQVFVSKTLSELGKPPALAGDAGFLG